MSSYRRIAALVAASGIAASAYAAEPPLTSDASWIRLAENVYQKTNFDGSTTRLSWGDVGAKYERSLVSAEIGKLSNVVANGHATTDEVDALAKLKEKLQSIPRSATAPVQIDSVNSGIICGRYHYDLDAQIAVGKDGATAISRTNTSADGVAPPPPYLTGINYYNESIITPFAGSPIDIVTSGSASTGYGIVVPTAIADWQKNSYTSVGPSNCTASASASFYLTGGTCGTGLAGFLSLTNTQSTCISSL